MDRSALMVASHLFEHLSERAVLVEARTAGINQAVLAEENEVACWKRRLRSAFHSQGSVAEAKGSRSVGSFA